MIPQGIRALYLCLLVSPLVARDAVDVIVMENGDRITGEIKSLSGGELQLSVPYIDGNLSIQWAKVARIESRQLFIVRTQDGSVYTGPLHTVKGGTDRPAEISIQPGAGENILLDRSTVVGIQETSNSVLQALSGEITTGVVYSKGNNATQFNIGSEVEYRRAKWGLTGAFNANLSSSEGAQTSTRNQLTVTGYHLMRRKNYFYSAFGGFLQSSAQGIHLQTMLGGGIGRYLKNTNRVQFSVSAGMVWLSTRYNPSVIPIGRQEVYAGGITTNLDVFVFKRTNFNATALFAPALSEPGRIYVQTNAAYYIKLFQKIDWNISFYGNWDNQPPGNFSGSDYGYSSGLKWTFGYK